MYVAFATEYVLSMLLLELPRYNGRLWEVAAPRVRGREREADARGRPYGRCSLTTIKAQRQLAQLSPNNLLRTQGYIFFGARDCRHGPLCLSPSVYMETEGCPRAAAASRPRVLAWDPHQLSLSSSVTPFPFTLVQGWPCRFLVICSDGRVARFYQACVMYEQSEVFV